MEPEMRTSQTERDRVVDRLRTHAGEGRLDVEELEQRVEAALSARTRGDLDAVETDLPRPKSPRRRRRRHPLRHRLVAISVLLVVIWALTGAGYLWPMWPIGGMAVAAFWPGCGSRRARVGSRRDAVQALRS
jgi:type VI protein secretion system component VasF